MQEKRFQVFISSTFEDLKVERRSVEEVIISTGDFPVQMEAFPAADEDQFSFIKKLIEQCDYYVLIVAGRYGSQADDGLSYTEKEYQYAVSKDIPVLVMLHNQRDTLPANKIEDTASGKAKLKKFITEISQGRLRKGWNTVDGLKLAVREALDNAKLTKPRVGWVRGDQIANVDALKELNQLRKENDEFKKTIGQLELDIPLPILPEHTNKVVIDLAPNFIGKGFQSYNNVGSNARIECTWIDMFPLFFSNLDWSVNDWNDECFYNVDEDSSCIKIGSALASFVSGLDTNNAFKLTKNSFDTLSSYFIEVGLMSHQGTEDPFTLSAKKFARRQRVSSASNKPNMTVIEGEINITSSDTSLGVDDEIPF